MEAADPAPRSSLTWAAWLPLLGPRLSPLLAHRSALDWLDGVAACVPEDCVGVLELRLGGSSPAVDFAFRLDRPDQALRVVSRLLSPPARAFLSRWASRESGLEPVSSLWLELDAVPGAPPGRLPAPLLCARLDGAVDPAWVTAVLLPAMCGGALSTARRRILDRCLDGLPAGVRLLYVFALLGRPEGEVRLELFSRDPAVLIAHLRRAVSEQAAERTAAASGLVEDADRFHLSFDVGEAVSPRIGLECGFELQPRREPRWARLLDRWVAHGLAAPAERDALLAWPGQDSLWTAPRLWPAAAVSLGGRVARGLSHLKLVLRPGRAPEAKAYLLFRHLPAGRAVGQEAASSGGGSPSSRASAAVSVR